LFIEHGIGFIGNRHSDDRTFTFGDTSDSSAAGDAAPVLSLGNSSSPGIIRGV
jgi:hypothetical protein